MHARKFVFVPVAMMAAMAAQSALATEVPGPLVDPAWLNTHKNDVTILQVSGTLKDFTTAPVIKTIKGKRVVLRVSGHVPGAHFVNFKDVRVKRDVEGKKVKGLVPLKADFEKRARSWGVDKHSAIVIVPKGLSTADVDEATRLYWQFKYYGQDNMAVLNGGMAGWLADGYKVATNKPSMKKGNWVATAERKNLIASTAEVKQAVENPGSIQLADARPQNQYMGVFTKPGEKAGHLPDAKDISPDLLTTATGASARFLPAASYRSMMKAKGLNPDAPTINYCNTGHLASGLWFVSHEIVGNKNSKLYDGSLVEYSLLNAGGTTDPAQLKK